MNDGQGAHRGTSHPLELPIGRWVAFAVCALLASAVVLLVIDGTGWALTVGIGLLVVSIVGFYRATRLIKRGYPDLEDR